MNKSHPPHTSAFTLLEVAIAMAILVVGITAAISVIMTGMRWSVDIKVNETALHTCTSVLNDANVFQLDAKNTYSFPLSNTTNSEGWLNGYYIVRNVNTTNVIANNGGTETDVTVTLYHGGDKLTGEESMKISHRFLVK